MLEKNRYALKEWAVAVDALLSGRQTLLLRKGGIFEKQGEFQIEHREFFLYPTLYHEKAGEIVPSARERLTEVEKHYLPDSALRLPGYCTVEEARWIDSLDRLQCLEGLHLLAPSAVEYRFNYGKQRGLNVLLLRAYSLSQPVALEMQRSYEGCVSWVDLGTELPTAALSPVLSDSEQVLRLQAVRDRLGR